MHPRKTDDSKNENAPNLYENIVMWMIRITGARSAPVQVSINISHKGEITVYDGELLSFKF